MKAKQVKIFAVCILSIFLIILVLHTAKVSMNAAATVGTITFAIAASNTASSTICGNGVCDVGENCAIDCAKSQAKPGTEITKTTPGNAFQIKITSFMLILLIMILCALAYIYLKEDRRTANGYWQYGFQRS